jgi:hypothetical protein
MQGDETSPKGKVKGLARLINIHAIPPIKNVKVTVTR